MKVNPELVLILEDILYEFETSKPEICLIPSNDPNIAGDGGKIRVTTTINPEWYQRMCQNFPRGFDKHNVNGPNKKKPRTIVKRKYTIQVIERMIKNMESSSVYAPYILDEAQSRFELYQRIGYIKPFENQF